jgi:uncharacterized protein YndB with AHSA1/START domain
MDRITERADPDVVARTIRIAADAATVFRYWTDPDLMVQWMGREATLVAEPGGTFRVDYNGTDIASGTFLEVDLPHRLVFTWGWEAPGDTVPPGASRVEVSFLEDGDATVVTVRHLGLPRDAIEGHATGWDQFLPQLDALMASR